MDSVGHRDCPELSSKSRPHRSHSKPQTRRDILLSVITTPSSIEQENSSVRSLLSKHLKTNSRIAETARPGNNETRVPLSPEHPVTFSSPPILHGLIPLHRHSDFHTEYSRMQLDDASGRWVEDYRPVFPACNSRSWRVSVRVLPGFAPRWIIVDG